MAILRFRIITIIIQISAIIGNNWIDWVRIHLDPCHLRCRTYLRYRTCMTYDIVRATYDIVLYIVRATSYVRYTGYRRTTSYVRHRMYIRCRTCTYDIVSDTYDIVGCHFNVSYTMSYVLKGPTISMYMTYDIVGLYCIRHRMYHT
jgi:hypothetical protein